MSKHVNELSQIIDPVIPKRLVAYGWVDVDELRQRSSDDLMDAGLTSSQILQLGEAMGHQFESAFEMNFRLEIEMNTKAHLDAQKRERRAELLRVATNLATGSLATATRLNIAPHIPNIVKQSVVMAQALIDTVDEEVNQ